MVSAEKGFSLIEVLAALGVFSVAAMGLIHLQSNSSQAARHIEARLLAQIVAENAMVETITSPEILEIGITSGDQVQRRRTFTWTRSINPTEHEGLNLVEISVADSETRQVMARLYALRHEAAQ